jgi:hypothetical protein
MVVRQRQIDGLVQTDQRSILRIACPGEQQDTHRGRNEYSKEPGAHKV